MTTCLGVPAVFLSGPHPPSPHVTFPAAVRCQIVSGVGLEAYWFSSYVWDFLSYLLPVSLAIILFELAEVNTLLDNGAAGALVLLFLLFGLSMVRGLGGLGEVIIPRAVEYAPSSSPDGWHSEFCVSSLLGLLHCTRSLG